MKLRLSKGDIAFTVFVVVALAILAGGLGLQFLGARKAHPLISHPVVSSPPVFSTIIAHENALRGTTDWMIPTGKEASTQIQAYASATSVLPGQTLSFYVSTQLEGTHYSIGVYRLGWYGGLGGQLKILQTDQIGHTQGYFDPNTQRLIGCTTCHIDTRLGLVEANWKPSYTLTVPSDWVTGVYLVKFIDANGMQTYAPFDVLGNAHSAYVAVTSDTTYGAYNSWGGYSLYSYNSLKTTDHTLKTIDPKTKSSGGGVKVSFDRPYVQGHGSGYVLAFEADAIHWFERQGYDLSYISSVDLHTDPKQLLQHRAYLSLGHDEYWTKEMRNGVEYARNHGVGLAFVGANTSYWQMRFEPDSTGIPNRTLVSYKVETDHNDLARDPLYSKDNTRVTAQWRDPVLARPENALVGIMFSSLLDGTKERAFPWQVSPAIISPLLQGTDLQPGQQYGCELVGYEWDRVFANGATPAGLQVLATSKTLSKYNTQDVSNTTYYLAASGAMVFATGSIYWTAALDSYRLSTSNSCATQGSVVPGMQKLMAHVMDALLINHRASN